MATEITWNTTSLTAEQIDSIIGAGTTERVVAMPNAAGHCMGRASGAWMANERDSYAAWRSLHGLCPSHYAGR